LIKQFRAGASAAAAQEAEMTADRPDGGVLWPQGARVLDHCFLDRDGLHAPIQAMA